MDVFLQISAGIPSDFRVSLKSDAVSPAERKSRGFTSLSITKESRLFKELTF